MQKNELIKLYSLNDTESVAEKCLRLFNRTPRALIFLKGDLGSGKTTFAQIFLKKLGVVTRVKSPTYSLIEPYTTPQRQIYHLDLYRIQDQQELEFLGLLDLLSEQAIFLVEWPHLLEALEIAPDLILEFSVKENQGLIERQVIIQHCLKDHHDPAPH